MHVARLHVLLASLIGDVQLLAVLLELLLPQPGVVVSLMAIDDLVGLHRCLSHISQILEVVLSLLVLKLREVNPLLIEQSIEKNGYWQDLTGSASCRALASVSFPPSAGRAIRAVVSAIRACALLQSCLLRQRMCSH